MSSLSPLVDKLDSVTFDALVAHQDPFGEPGCRFDLSGFRFVSPAALVQLAAACHALHAAGCQPVIALRGIGIPSYLLRSGFVGAVSSVARFDPPIKRTFLRAFDDLRGSNPLLIEVTCIESGLALEELLNRIVDVLEARLRYPPNDAYDVAIAVSEVGQNTFDHNGRTCGFLAMQGYQRGADHFLEIGVADYGDGLAATLSRNPKNPPIIPDDEAIAMATALGTSQYDDPTRGTGLYHLLEIAYKHGGMAQIRTGTATARYRMDRRKGWGFRVAWMPGTQVVLSLPSKVSR